MTISLEDAAELLRDALRDNVRNHSLRYLIQGGLLTTAGVVGLLYPLLSYGAVVTLLGWLLVAGGIVQGIGLIGTRAVPHFWLQTIAIALSVMIGIIFLRQPGDGLLTITLLLVIYFMIGGLSKIIFSLTIRPLANWHWILLSGLVGITLSLWLWNMFPVSGAWSLSLLLGIQLVSEGCAFAYLAWNIQDNSSLK